MFGLFKKTPRVTVEEQLRQLAECGVVPSPGADLFELHSREQMEKKPYGPLIEALSMDCCTALWMCDYERIEDHGDYRDVLLRLESMHAGLGLAEISDFVDVNAGQARVEFRWRGEARKLVLKVDNDWLDPQLLRSYAEMLEGTGRKLYSNERDYGQSALLAIFDEKQMACFQALSPVKLKPMA
ncbi:MAG: hypothetical protein J0I12_06000 [Candidatus Eremiobacteraeota bacterium]|nr:hypothetical protein [Candidatus Eremiobacteraeota bacterium]